jgi:hypothetical protein
MAASLLAPGFPFRFLGAVNLDLLVLGYALLVQELGHLSPVVTGQLDVELSGVLVVLDRPVAVELLDVRPILPSSNVSGSSCSRKCLEFPE